MKYYEYHDTKHIPGCESKNHTHCYGCLWTCECCGKVTCHAEGSTDRPDLCDDCWSKSNAKDRIH